ncbi:MAG: arginine--tRNA ligase [Candidatus Kerfeldbacteria bacterium]|nr:arginine--tRNA ligase [Candidatus Kerfeldbacteria bacterium]
MKQELSAVISDTIKEFLLEKERKDVAVPKFDVDVPQNEKHGDYATNVAFLLAPKLGGAPMEVAEQLVERFRREQYAKYIKKVDAAPPGFINFRLSNTVLEEGIRYILDKGDLFGTSPAGRKRKVNVEFISANPTGPLHLGNGRGAFLGDVLANVLAASGYTVTREYYINDQGNQIDMLGDSVTRRYLQLQGLNVPYPEECYQGDYIKTIASGLRLRNYKLTEQSKMEKIRERVKELALTKMLDDIRRLVEKKLKIKMDVWFSERQMYESGEVDELLQYVKKSELLYKSEGAWWMRTSRFGDDKDRVLIKDDGSPTYFLSDIVYLYDKLLKRKFRRAIILLGADHHGYINRLHAVEEALTNEKGRLNIVIMQLVRLIEAGIEIRMSKRKGKFVTLEDVIDDVGLDVTRFFFLMHAPGTHMDFDLSLARDRSEKNPVYYVQYAHARIANILQQPEVKAVIGVKFSRGVQITEDAERALVFELLKYPDLVQEVAGSYEVQRLPFYAMDIARTFHTFYAQCRVIDQGKIHESRVAIVQATKIVLANILKLMGVTAPTRL